MTFQESEQRKWEADEWYCVNEFLNKLNVPKESTDGKPYSTVGRIAELMRMCESDKYPARCLSDNDFIEHAIKKSTL
jgi:hypothetical protein